MINRIARQTAVQTAPAAPAFVVNPLLASGLAGWQVQSCFIALLASAAQKTSRPFYLPANARVGGWN